MSCGKWLLKYLTGQCQTFLWEELLEFVTTDESLMKFKGRLDSALKPTKWVVKVLVTAQSFIS